MKATWSGALCFGHVTIPIKLFNASKRASLPLKLLEKGTHCSVRYQKVCEDTGEVVENENVVRGYEYEEGKFVEVDERDFERANPRKTTTIDIKSFVSENDINPKLYEKPYYIEPEEGYEKAYVLLREALEESRKVAIARVVIRGRERVVALYADGTDIVAVQLRFANEIVPPREVDAPVSALYSQEELDTMKRLVDRMSGSLRTPELKDRYTEELLEAINEKVRGETKTKEMQKHTYTDMSELLRALEESVTER